MFAYPELEVAARRDSNIAMLPDPLRQADTIWYLRPSVRLEAKQGVNLYDVSYRGEYGRYDSSKLDNFNNHDLAAHSNMTFDARNNLKLGLQYQDRFDPRGALPGINTPTPNQWRQPSATGLYTYGAEDAQGKLELQGGYLDKRYVNNRLATSALDHSETGYGGTFLWRVLPKTYATFNLRQTVFDYKETTVTLDSKNTFALLGLRWEATAATSGKFALGNVTKKFDAAGHDAGRQDLSGPGWEGGINWKPRTYSSVDFITQRSTNDSTGLGDFDINQAYQVLWTHAWTSRISSALTGSYSTDKFSRSALSAAAGGADREDTNKSAGLRLTYSMQRWLKLGAEYIYSLRDSNDNNFDYKRNQLMFFVSGTL